MCQTSHHRSHASTRLLASLSTTITFCSGLLINHPLRCSFRGVGADPIQHLAYDLRRIYLLGTWVNKGQEKGPKLLGPAGSHTESLSHILSAPLYGVPIVRL